MDLKIKSEPTDQPCDYSEDEIQNIMHMHLLPPPQSSVSIEQYVKGAQRGLEIQNFLAHGIPLRPRIPFGFVPSFAEEYLLAKIDNANKATAQLWTALHHCEATDPALDEEFAHGLMALLECHDSWYPKSTDFLRQLDMYCQEIGNRYEPTLLQALDCMDTLYDLVVQLSDIVEESQAIEYSPVFNRINGGLDHLIDSIERQVIDLRLPQRMERSIDDKARKLLDIAKQGRIQYNATVLGNRRRRKRVATPFDQNIRLLEEVIRQVAYARANGFSMGGGDRFHRYTEGPPVLAKAEVEVTQLAAYYEGDGEINELGGYGRLIIFE